MSDFTFKNITRVNMSDLPDSWPPALKDFFVTQPAFNEEVEGQFRGVLLALAEQQQKASQALQTAEQLTNELQGLQKRVARAERLMSKGG